jgi:hypothetical protein
MSHSTGFKAREGIAACKIATAFGFAIVYDAAYLTLADLREGEVCNAPED